MDEYKRPVMSLSIPKGATKVKLAQFKAHLEHLNGEIHSLEEQLDDLYTERGVVRDVVNGLEAHMKELDKAQEAFDRFYADQS